MLGQYCYGGVLSLLWSWTSVFCNEESAEEVREGKRVERRRGEGGVRVDKGEDCRDRMWWVEVGVGVESGPSAHPLVGSAFVDRVFNG